MASHFPVVRPAQADGPNMSLAQDIDKAIGNAVDLAEGTEARFAIVVSVVWQDGLNGKLTGTGERNAVFLDVALSFSGSKPTPIVAHAAYRLSTNTPCWPKRFQKAQGMRMPILPPVPLIAVAVSMRAPISSVSSTKSRMVQKWMLGVSYQA